MSMLFDKHDIAEHRADLGVKRSAASARDDALEAVEKSNDEAAAAFELALRVVAECGAPFTTDDVLAERPELEEVQEKRVFGAVLMRLKKQGYLIPMGYGESNRRQSHARPKRIWRKAK